MVRVFPRKVAVTALTFRQPPSHLLPSTSFPGIAPPWKCGRFPLRNPLWANAVEKGFNKTFADGKCHVTSVNYSSDLKSIVRLTLPPKLLPNARVTKLSQLPIDAVEALGAIIKDGKVLPKQLQRNADELSNKLEQRLFPASPIEVRKAHKEILNETLEKFPALIYEYNVWKNRPALDKHLQKLVQKRLATRRYNWKPLTYKNSQAALVYALSRFPSHFAEMRRVLGEFDRNGFVPTKVLDYGSGIGSAFWAAYERWGDEVKEYSLIDSDKTVRHFSMDLLRGRNYSGSGEMISRNLFFRKALFPSPKHTYDLVILHRMLIEMPSHEARVALIEELWKRTNKYMVIVDSSRLGAFQALSKIRDFVLTSGYDFDLEQTKALLYSHGKLDQDTIELFADRKTELYEKYCRARERLPEDVEIPTRLEIGHVFAPCPHDNACPLMARREPCQFNVRWQEFRADHKTRSTNRDGTETGKFCYLILAKGKRPADEQQTQPRILELKRAHHCVSCRVCTPSDGVQNFVAGRRTGKVYKRIRRAQCSQLLPVKFELLQTGTDSKLKQISSSAEEIGEEEDASRLITSGPNV